MAQLNIDSTTCAASSPSRGRRPSPRSSTRSTSSRSTSSSAVRSPWSARPRPTARSRSRPRATSRASSGSRIRRTLLIPERVGNNLAFGLTNIITNGKIGMICLVPATGETLRISGTAEIYDDADLVASLSLARQAGAAGHARAHPALLLPLRPLDRARQAVGSQGLAGARPRIVRQDHRARASARATTSRRRSTPVSRAPTPRAFGRTARRRRAGSLGEAQGRAVPSAGDDGRQPRRDRRRVARDVSPGVRQAGPGDPQPRGQPHRPLRRSSKPCCAASTAGSRRTWRRCCRRSRPSSRASGRDPARPVGRRARRAHQEVRRRAHLLHRPVAQGVPDQSAGRHEPRLSGESLHRVSRHGVRSRQGHERRHRHVVADRHVADLQLLRTQGQGLHRRDLDRNSQQPRRDGDFGWMGKYFFQDIFTDAVRSNEYVKDVDIYLVTPSGTWSLLHVGKKLDPALVERIDRIGRDEVMDADGRHRHDLQPRRRPAGGSAKDDPVSHKLVIRQITYDTGLAREAVIKVFMSSMIVLALMLPIVFWIASRLLQRQILDPLFNLRGEAGAIAEGDLEHRHCQHRPARRDRPSRPQLRRDAQTPFARPSSTSRRRTCRSSGSCRAPFWP